MIEPLKSNPPFRLNFQPFTQVHLIKYFYLLQQKCKNVLFLYKNASKTGIDNYKV